ncbi:EpsI family protein [Xylophilus rhododendri]|uniref:EpsI family protein n=1 Tax=Xylophilus rhododendri TaxID=2697032 RepID=A0A857JAB4_9BURK|nr:exosortase-associated protein EpsI, B-type [Xylophilus rhododendri]QHI99979.1 EpsI family protein [Xylophilus rhododendri]
MKTLVRSCILMVAMFMAAGLAWALTPRTLLVDGQVPIDLAAMVPQAFGDWKELPTASAAVVDPGQQQLISEIYSQTLSRVYVNSQNYVVMLSIAYGRDQRDGFQLHQPEACYPAQGFTVLERRPRPIKLDGHDVTAVQMNTQGPRVEPLTYWTMVGQRNYQGGLAKKIAEMHYGLNGTIPDGMLVRISSVDPKTESAYAIQARFAADMTAALPDAVRARFVGARQP